MEADVRGGSGPVLGVSYLVVATAVHVLGGVIRWAVLPVVFSIIDPIFLPLLAVLGKMPELLASVASLSFYTVEFDTADDFLSK